MKKIIAMILVIALTAAISVGATLAYLTDTDEDVNVMTMGNVQIEQNEWQRAEGVGHTNTQDNPAKEGDLVPFVQGQPAYPAVISDNSAFQPEMSDLFYWGVYAPGGNGLWDDDELANARDKIVMVTNTGKTDTYFRTIVAFECPEGFNGDLIHLNANTGWYTDEKVNYASINGVRYYLYEYTYKGNTGSGAGVLAAGETALPSLLQVCLDPKTTNEDVAKLGDSWDVLVVSQAVQTAGFADAKTALDTAFGKTSEKAVEWFADIAPEQPPVKPEGNWSEVADTSWIGDGSADTFKISTAAELAGLAQLVNSGTAPGKNGKPFNEKTVMLTADIDLAGMCWTPIGGANGNEFWGTFDGNGHTIKNLYVEGTANVGLFGGIFAGMDWTNVVATVKNVTVDGATIIAAENAGVIVGRTYGNVENCTVKNATITVSDGKAGAIVGTTANDSTMVYVSNNSAENVTITGTRATGAIAGRIWESCCTHKGNTWENVTVNDAVCNDEVGELY